MDYRQSGVDIDAGNEVVRRIRALARGTFTPGVLSDIGSFGGLFRLVRPRRAIRCWSRAPTASARSSRVAFMTGVHDTIGRDLVNHCVNDILVQGARPLFFLDYLATGRLEPDVAVRIVEGLAAACRENGCALLGGETAEMPGFYADGEYDVAGFIVGVVERERSSTAATIRAGDVLIGMPSSGLHTNGYSLARASCSTSRVWRSTTSCRSSARRSARRCSRRTDRICRVIRPLLERRPASKGMAHITGGGITDNLPRVLPEGARPSIERGSWTVPPLFQWLQRAGGVPATTCCARSTWASA